MLFCCRVFSCPSCTRGGRRPPLGHRDILTPYGIAADYCVGRVLDVYSEEHVLERIAFDKASARRVEKNSRILVREAGARPRDDESLEYAAGAVISTTVPVPPPSITGLPTPVRLRVLSMTRRSWYTPLSTLMVSPGEADFIASPTDLRGPEGDTIIVFSKARPEEAPERARTTIAQI